MAAMLRWKRLKDVELVYDAPSGLQLLLYTDVAGGATQGAMALAATLNFPATTGKQTYTLPLDNIYGTLIRVKITSAARVILYAGIVRLLDIGTLFMGQNAEIWDSLELNVGS